jgi:hypothetical protein
MRRTLSLSALLLALAACGDDPGYPWSEELSSSTTTGASSYGPEVVRELHEAFATLAPFESFPEGCGTFSGVLVGGVPKDTDGDGIPDDATLTFSHEECFVPEQFYDGKIRMKDPGATPGFDFTSDYTLVLTESRVMHRQESRQIRFHGSSTTGKMSFREMFTISGGVGAGDEGFGTSVQFTLTAAEGTSLDVGEFGAGTLTFSGMVDRKDDAYPTTVPWRFKISTPIPLTITPGCDTDYDITGGVIYGILNGLGPVEFTRTYSACGAYTIEVDGTTD